MSKTKELKTREDLLAALVEISGTKQTTKEMYEQRVSFILGSVDKESGVTRPLVEEVLEQEGIKEAC